jgi:MFS family permease
MKGLVLKDLYAVIRSWKTLLLMALLYGALSLFAGAGYSAYLLALFLMILPMSTFSADELARWDGFAAALPGGRRAVVRSKYLLLLLVAAAALVLSLILNLLSLLTGREDGSFGERMLTVLSFTWIGLLVNAAAYPFLFRYGAQKGRIYLIIAIGFVCGLGAVGMVLLSLDDSTLWTLLGSLHLPLAAVAAAAVLLLAAALGLSYRVSQGVYEKKEF